MFLNSNVFPGSDPLVVCIRVFVRTGVCMMYLSVLFTLLAGVGAVEDC